MKKLNHSKLSINKFSVAKLNTLDSIKGGAHTEKGTTPIFAGKPKELEKAYSIGDPGSDIF